MSNRLMVRNYQTLEKGPVGIFARFTVGATGAPTLVAKNSKGVASITRTGVGAYTLNLGTAATADTYQICLAMNYISVYATPASINGYVVQDNSASGNIKVQFVSAAGTAVELANGEDIRIEFVFSNSTAL
jgi:hypothetical protein